jgi:hypothetical protein
MRMRMNSRTGRHAHANHNYFTVLFVAAVRANEFIHGSSFYRFFSAFLVGPREAKGVVDIANPPQSQVCRLHVK